MIAPPVRLPSVNKDSGRRQRSALAERRAWVLPRVRLARVSDRPIAALIAATLVLTACAQNNGSNPNVVGKWTNSGTACADYHNVEFLKDGVAIFDGVIGKYSFLSDHRMKIDGPSGAVVASVTVSSGMMTIASEPMCRDTMTFRKVATFDLIKPDGQERLLVPLLIGQDDAAAKKLLLDAGLKVQTKAVASEANPVGRVVDQEPKAGANTERGATVTISVSSGAPATEVPAQIPVPLVRGRTANDAANILGQAGFRTASRTESSSDFASGVVIRTEPPAGTPTDRSSVVTLIVSR